MGSIEGGPILGLNHITLVVHELDTAVAAYETLFAQPCTRRGVAEGLNWAWFTLANTALVLVAPHGEPSFLAMHIAHRPTGPPAHRPTGPPGRRRRWAPSASRSRTCKALPGCWSAAAFRPPGRRCPGRTARPRR